MTGTRTPMVICRGMGGVRLVFGVSVVLLAVVSMIAGGAAPALAVGTSGDTGVIYNGMFTFGDTVPNAAGKLVIRYKISTTRADSRYAYITDGNTVAITVDTAYDLLVLGTPLDTSSAIGDTARYVYWIENLGNATIQIDLDTYRSDNQNDSDWGTLAYRVLYDFGNDSAITSDTGVGSISLPAGASRQVMVAVAVPTTANAGETSHIVFRVSDLAPLRNGSSTGDAWQAGVPILNAAAANERDTQWDTVVTTVKGANLKTAKVVSEYTSGRSRPGDTLIFQITLDNDGNDSAYGVEVIDAIPDNTRYVPYSADSGIFLGNNPEGIFGTFTADSDILVGLDSDALGGTPMFDDSAAAQGGVSDTITIRSVRWVLRYPMGESNGDANTNNPDFDNGIYDAARVTFWVTIR